MEVPFRITRIDSLISDVFGRDLEVEIFFPAEGQALRRGQWVQRGFFGKQIRAPNSINDWLCVPGSFLGTIWPAICLKDFQSATRP
jgi:hypothetical protein